MVQVWQVKCDSVTGSLWQFFRAISIWVLQYTFASWCHKYAQKYALSCNMVKEDIFHSTIFCQQCQFKVLDSEVMDCMAITSITHILWLTCVSLLYHRHHLFITYLIQDIIFLCVWCCVFLSILPFNFFLSEEKNYFSWFSNAHCFLSTSWFCIICSLIMRKSSTIIKFRKFKLGY